MAEVAGLNGVGRRRGSRLAALVAAVALMMTSCVSTAGLRIVATPDVPTPPGPPPFRADGFRTAFDAVSGTGTTDVWAVGGVGWDVYGGWQATPFAAHFDGHRWAAVAINVHGVFGLLNGVAAISPTDVWATGPDDQVPYPGGLSTNSAALLHYDGLSWRVVNAPRSATQVLHLNAISALSAADIWAVGGSELPGKPFTPVALHYNGTSWTQVPFPASSGELTTVSTAGVDVVFAAGTTELVHSQAMPYIGRWDGQNWQLLPTLGAPAARSDVRAIGAVSANEAWTVGDERTSEGNVNGARAWHWTSGHWVTTTPDAQPGASLTSVDAHDPRHVWAAGLPGGAAKGNLLIVTWTTRWTTAFTFAANNTSQPLQAIRLLQGHVFSVGGTSQTIAVQN